MKRQHLGLAILGLGVMGERHARVIRDVPNAHLAAVMDVDQEKANTFGAAEGVPGFTSLDEAIACEGVDAVVICVPDQLHVEPCLKAAEAGKHILLEKPIATSVEDADTIIEACERAGVRLMVGHTVRFDPRYNRAFEAVSQGDIGEIIHLYARRCNASAHGERLGGRTSVAFFLGVHDLDIMRWLAGSEITEAYAISNTKVLGHLGVEDTILATLRFQNGSIALLELCWAMPMGRVPQAFRLDAALRVIGTKGTIQIDCSGPEMEIYREGVAGHPDTVYAPQVAGESYGALRAEDSHFVNCILQDKDFIISPQDAREAVAVVEAIHRSLESGQPQPANQ